MASNATTPELETLKLRIIEDIEAKLALKEDSLWKRGQVEIKKLQVEHQNVSSSLAEMQEKQEALILENQKLQGAFVNVTSQFQMLVSQIREVLHVLPSSAVGEAATLVKGVHVPSEGSTSASDTFKDEVPFEFPLVPLIPTLDHGLVSPAERGEHTPLSTALFGEVALDGQSNASHYCTPQGFALPAVSSAPPSGPVPALPAPTSTPQRLLLADHLELTPSATATAWAPSPVLPMVAASPTAYTGFNSMDLLDTVSGKPFRLEINEELAAEKAMEALMAAYDCNESNALANCDGSPKEKQLRAEAQAFVPSAQKMASPLSMPPGLEAFDAQCMFPNALTTASPISPLFPHYMGSGVAQVESS